MGEPTEWSIRVRRWIRDFRRRALLDPKTRYRHFAAVAADEFDRGRHSKNT